VRGAESAHGQEYLSPSSVLTLNPPWGCASNRLHINRRGHCRPALGVPPGRVCRERNRERQREEDIP